MIDTTARKELAEALRQLLGGTLNNLEFDDKPIETSRDRGVWAIWYSTWTCYDDFIVHDLLLTDGQILDLKRCVLFLHTDLEYEYQDSKPGLGRITQSLGDLLRRLVGISPFDRTAHLEFGVWPFARRSDYEEALRNPRLLAGTKPNKSQHPTASS